MMEPIPILVQFTAKVRSMVAEIGFLDVNRTTVKDLKAMIAEKTNLSLRSIKIIGLTKSAISKPRDDDLLGNVDLKTKTEKRISSVKEESESAPLLLRCVLTIMGAPTASQSNSVNELHGPPQGIFLCGDGDMQDASSPDNANINSSSSSSSSSEKRKLSLSAEVEGINRAPNSNANANTQKMHSIGNEDNQGNLEDTNVNVNVNVNVTDDTANDEYQEYQEYQEYDRLVVNDLDCDYAPASAEWLSLCHHTESCNLHFITSARPGKKLLVLDLDHTLLDFTSKDPGVTICDMKRPYLDEFLTKV